MTSRSLTLGAVVSGLMGLALALSGCSDVDSSEGSSEEAAGAEATNTTAPRPEFVELDYEETIGGDGEMQFEFTSCTDTDPGVRSCSYKINNLTLVGNHTGRSKESRHGTFLFTQESCTTTNEGTGTVVEDTGQGTIVTEVGGELFFELASTMCNVATEGLVQLGGTWRVTGGTERFEDASGVMTSSVRSDGVGTSQGTLRVRADRWGAP